MSMLGKFILATLTFAIFATGFLGTQGALEGSVVGIVALAIFIFLLAGIVRVAFKEGGIASKEKEGVDWSEVPRDELHIHARLERYDRSRGDEFDVIC